MVRARRDWYSDWISGVVSLDGTQDHLWITAGSHLHSDEENRSDYYPKDMFVQGLTKTTHIDQVDNGELSFELTISGDTYNALTYRSFRMPLYTEGNMIHPQFRRCLVLLERQVMRKAALM